MSTHSLTAEEADKVNAANGFGRSPGETEEDNPGAVEGDSYPSFDLPNGERYVFVGAGGFVQVEADDSDSDYDERQTLDERPEFGTEEYDPSTGQTTRRSDTNPTGETDPRYQEWLASQPDNKQASANVSQEPVSPQNPPASA